MNESSKSKVYWGPVELEALKGKGIDIGCGADPVTPTARRFDKEDGDANRISDYIKEEFDFVYASHCLEHMHEPKSAILEWWKLVKVGGHLFILVPDEDLYEQGIFPSRFNDDHKATFTLCKAASWSPLSHNVMDLARSLPGGELISLELQDRGYDRSLMSFGQRKPTLFIRFLTKIYNLLQKQLPEPSRKGFHRLLTFYFPVDQTSGDYNAQAQIQLIVRKTK
jgi:SAM-dependent methyltransferase